MTKLSLSKEVGDLNVVENSRKATAPSLSKVNAALAALDQTLSSRPDDVQLLTKRGVLLRQLNRLEESLSVLSALAAAQGGTLAVRQELAMTLRLQGAYASSLQLSEEILRDHPDHRPSLLARIDTNIQARDFNNALLAADKALVRYPDDVQLLTKRGVLLRQLNRLEESFSVLSALAAAQGGTLAVRQELAMTLRLQGAYASSLQLSEEILRDHPDHRPSLLARIDTNIQARDFGNALLAADMALVRYPDDMDFALKYASILRQAGRTKDSISYLRSLLERQFTDVELRYQLAVSLAATAESAESDAFLDSVLRDAPGHFGAFMARINGLLRDHRFEEALSWVNQALAKWPDNKAIKIKRASILHHLGDADAQLRELRDVRNAAPDSALAAQSLYKGLVQDWKFDEAEALLRDFVANATDTPENRKQKIKFCLGAGEVKMALGLAQAWLAEDPASTAAMHAIYDAKVRGLHLDDLDDLEAELIRLNPASEQIAMSIAAGRRAKLDLTGAAEFLETYLCQYPWSLPVRRYLASLLFKMPDLERCEAFLGHYLKDMPELAVSFSAHFAKFGERDRACALLEGLEADIQKSVAPHTKAVLLKNIHQKYVLMGEPAAGRICEMVRSWPHVRPDVRHYFDKVAGVASPPVSPSAGSFGPPLRDIAFGGAQTPITLPPEEIAIAHRIAPHEGDYDDWLKKIMRATTTSWAVNSCYQVYPERLEEFNGLVDFPEADLLFKHSERNEPFLITSAHHGPQLAAWWLWKHFPKTRIVSVRRREGQDASISGAQLVFDGSATSGREVLAAIKDGATIAGSLDQSFYVHKKYSESRFTIAMQLFDFPPVRVSNLIPRLAWRYRLPSYWIESRIVENRIRVKVARLPDATGATEFAPWAQNWIHHYKSNLENYLRLGPQHLNLGNPLFELLLKATHDHRIATVLSPETK